MGQAEYDHELPTDILKHGRFAFTGAPDIDVVADIITVKDKQIGLMFKCLPEIQLLLDRATQDCTPTDNDRILWHLESLHDEEYICSLGRWLEFHFQNWEPPLKVINVWNAGYSYRRLPELAKHCRFMWFIPTKEHKEEYAAVVDRCCIVRREKARDGEPPWFMDVIPGGLPGNF